MTQNRAVGVGVVDSLKNFDQAEIDALNLVALYQTLPARTIAMFPKMHFPLTQEK